MEICRQILEIFFPRAPSAKGTHTISESHKQWFGVERCKCDSSKPRVVERLFVQRACPPEQGSHWLAAKNVGENCRPKIPPRGVQIPPSPTSSTLSFLSSPALFAFWLRSSVVSVLFSVKTETVPTGPVLFYTHFCLSRVLTAGLLCLDPPYRWYCTVSRSMRKLLLFFLFSFHCRSGCCARG